MKAWQSEETAPDFTTQLVSSNIHAVHQIQHGGVLSLLSTGVSSWSQGSRVLQVKMTGDRQG